METRRRRGWGETSEISINELSGQYIGVYCKALGITTVLPIVTSECCYTGGLPYNAIARYIIPVTIPSAEGMN